MREEPSEVFLPAMAKRYCIELDEHGWEQLLDGLECRAESWRRTAEFLRIGGMPGNELFLIEDCIDVEEAEDLATCYDGIIRNIKRQMEAQP